MRDMTPTEILRACIASGSRILDWLEEGEIELATETLHYLIDDLELLSEKPA